MRLVVLLTAALVLSACLAPSEGDIHNEDECGPAVVLTDDWTVPVVGLQPPADAVAALAGLWTADVTWSDGSQEIVQVTFADAGTDLIWIEHPDLPPGAPLHVCDRAGSFNLKATLTLADRGWTETLPVEFVNSENMGGRWFADGRLFELERCGNETSCGAILSGDTYGAEAPEGFRAKVMFRTGESSSLSAATENGLVTLTRPQ
jgi:hypothetical protein